MKNSYPRGWSRCPICDEWYDPHGERAQVHDHPEPQSGPPRDAWLASGLHYEKWTETTNEGREWIGRNRSDAHKLRLLAEWMDAEQDRGRWPSTGREVQSDLRRMADRFQAIDGV